MREASAQCILDVVHHKAGNKSPT